MFDKKGNWFCDKCGEPIAWDVHKGYHDYVTRVDDEVDKKQKIEIYHRGRCADLVITQNTQ